MRKKIAYLVGIKGVAMTSLAVYLKESGYEVIGSDVPDIFPTDKVLKAFDIKIYKGFSEKNINKNYHLVVVTGAHGGKTNIEAQTAIKLGIPTYMHGEFLGKVMDGKFGISIAGCHGKTTTSSMIAYLLEKSKLRPSFAVGTAEVNGLNAGGHYGRGEIFVAEADEYMTCPQTDPTPRFMWQNPKILVVTNIEYDHPDAFSDLDEVKNAYLSFINKLSKDAVIITCLDNKNVSNILSKIKLSVLTYGFSPRADYSISRFHFNEGFSFMRIKFKNMDMGEYMLSIPGKHNMLNAVAAIIVADQVGVKQDIVKKNILSFTGCKRRFEKIFQIDNIFLYDDYAHHPSEIKATLSAVKGWFPKMRVIVIFQPHTYSRTKALLKEFGKSFYDADIALICDIYPSAREKFDNSINSNMLAAEANKFKKNSFYSQSKSEVIDFLDKNVKTGDLIITMGAGDIYLWHKDIEQVLQKKLT
ncbi:UDP-N-acetylmuramate--L-alanine ligase [Candidatus Gottesmanbacteria bacterium]|nr:UDP-N-acetylmuramate--L-alanine ligase [Candidatus Gottesmanbacteria bacterium]